LGGALRLASAAAAPLAAPAVDPDCESLLETVVVAASRDVQPVGGESMRLGNGLPLEPLRLAALDDGWLARSGIAECRGGLALVTGPPRSGRSTTVAALLAHILAHDRRRVTTLERRVEHALASDTGRVSQHEIGRDFPSQAAGLAAIARSDADVVYAGAIEDWSAFDAVLGLAAQHRLVIATLDAPTTGYALGWLFGLCPAERLASIRAEVAECLAWLLCQRLVPRTSGQDWCWSPSASAASRASGTRFDAVHSRSCTRRCRPVRRSTARPPWTPGWLHCASAGTSPSTRLSEPASDRRSCAR
jgi:hypothetical protein